MKAYITKHALTRGIEEVEGEEWECGSFRYRYRHGSTLSKYFWCERGDWHRTREAAVARAEEMRDAEVTKLEARVAELKAMTFGEER